MAKSVKISESEWRVCKVLWHKSPLTGNEIVEQLGDSSNWSPRTIKTMLNRLIKKGVLGYKGIGREYHYFPRISEDECVASHTQSFVDRVFGGEAGAMVAAFIKQQRLSKRDIAELKAILEEKSPKK
jgi:BlaI family transcriptional regulator, penicillinase repressor